jgi:beta-xylosidase
MKYFTNPILIISCFFLILSSCKNGDKSSKEEITSTEKTSITNPVLPGDYADPSVVRKGNDYWATATSSEWAPLFPILHSDNLQDWKIKGHVFPDKRPDWAEAHFWAPEIAYDNGKFYIYYTAKKKDGPLCVGVASADKATGPYKDHGPIVCQEAGAIDGFQIRDEEGNLFLIWKEDGNSRGEPTPMWGQRMNEDRTALIGERFELFRNEPDTWEGNLVEGAYLLKKNGYYYTFYSGDSCCGRGCTYGIGVARAKNLRGPWEKYEKNPLKRETENWKCAGHGSMVQDNNGRYFFLYHAYNKNGTVYTGRQGLISEVVWNKKTGWPEFKDEATDFKMPERSEIPEYHADFSTADLSPYWQWPVGIKPEFKLQDDALIVQANENNIGAVLARRTLTPDYKATTKLNIPTGNIEAGLSAIGDVYNALGISVSNQEVFVWKVKDGKREKLVSKNITQTNGVIELKLLVNDGEKYSFSWREEGSDWKPMDVKNNFVNGYYLPPWDRAVRIGLTVKGKDNKTAKFNAFHINPLKKD